MERLFTPYFKLPFKMDTINLYCFDSKGQMVLMKDICSDIELSDTFIPVINGVIDSEPNDDWEYMVAKDGSILKDVLLYKGERVIIVRGWGYLTGVGGLNLDVEIASQIQDDLGDYLLERLTGKKNEA